MTYNFDELCAMYLGENIPVASPNDQAKNNATPTSGTPGQAAQPGQQPEQNQQNQQNQQKQPVQPQKPVGQQTEPEALIKTLTDILKNPQHQQYKDTVDKLKQLLGQQNASNQPA